MKQIKWNKPYKLPTASDEAHVIILEMYYLLNDTMIFYFIIIIWYGARR